MARRTINKAKRKFLVDKFARLANAEKALREQVDDLTFRLIFKQFIFKQFHQK